MKRYSKLLIILSALIFLAIGFSASRSTNQTPEEQINQNKAKASVKITLGEEEKTFDLSKYIGMELLPSMEDSGINIEKEGSGEESFVIGLEGKKGRLQKTGILGIFGKWLTRTSWGRILRDPKR